MATRIILIVAITTLCLVGVYVVRHQPPAEYVQLQRDLKKRIVYENYAKKDWRYAPPGQTTVGNCAVFAYTALTELAKMNKAAYIKLCRLPDGTGHAYTYTKDGYAFDVRFKEVSIVETIDCK